MIERAFRTWCDTVALIVIPFGTWRVELGHLGGPAGLHEYGNWDVMGAILGRRQA